MMKRIIAMLLALVVLSLSAAAEDGIPTDGILIDEGITEGTEFVDEVVDVIPEDPETEFEVTYIFLNGEEAVDSQTVRDGDTVKAPAAPEAPQGKVFSGWYVGDTLLFAEGDTEVVSVQPDVLYVYVEAVFVDVADSTEQQEEAASPVDEEQPSVPLDEQPGEEAPADGQPAEEAPADGQPTEEAPADEQPAADDGGAGAAATEETEAPADQKPSPDGEGGSASALTDEVPGDPSPADQPQPADEQPTEEAPADEQPTEEQPAQTPPVPNALVYTGEAQELVSAEGAWLYSMDGEAYTADLPSAVDAGEYLVYFKAADEIDAGTQSILVTIAKADVVYTPPMAMTGEE